MGEKRQTHLLTEGGGYAKMEEVYEEGPSMDVPGPVVSRTGKGCQDKRACPPLSLDELWGRNTRFPLVANN